MNLHLHRKVIQVKPMGNRTLSLLEIFVLPRCFGSERAVEIAQRLEDRPDRTVEVRVVDLSQPNAVCPDAVFAVPTYVLNGKVISLGTPEEDWLIAQLYPPSGHRREMDR